MKNTFYFTVKALLLSRCSNVSLDFLVMQKTDENEMKFAQLKRYDIRNIFLKNLTKNLVEKLFPDPFLKNQNCAYTWINSLNFCTVLFHCMPIWGLIKDKKDLELVSLPQFLHNFWKKKIILFILWTDEISSSGCLYFVRHLPICVLQLFVNQVVMQ